MNKAQIIDLVEKIGRFTLDADVIDGYFTDVIEEIGKRLNAPLLAISLFRIRAGTSLYNLLPSATTLKILFHGERMLSRHARIDLDAYDSTWRALTGDPWAFLLDTVENLMVGLPVSDEDLLAGLVSGDQADMSGWLDYTDNTYWEAVESNATWNSTLRQWEPVYDAEEEEWNLALQPIGNWEVGFRPDKMRITHKHNADGSQNDFILFHTCTGGGCPNYIVTDANLPSDAEKDCFFDGYDIRELGFSPDDDGENMIVTRIMFYSGN